MRFVQNARQHMNKTLVFQCEFQQVLVPRSRLSLWPGLESCVVFRATLVPSLVRLPSPAEVFSRELACGMGMSQRVAWLFPAPGGGGNAEALVKGTSLHV